MIRFTEVHRDISEMVTSFAENELAPRAEHADAVPEYPRSSIAEVGQLGLLGASLPEQYGGADGDALMTVLIVEALAKGCASTAAVIHAHSQAALTLVAHGTDAQKEKILPGLSAGSTLASSAVFERDAQGDGRSANARAERDGNDWLLTGEKISVVGAAEAGLILVVARTTEATPDGRGLAVFLLENGADVDGVTLADEGGTMGLRGARLCTLILENCRVPGDALLGGEASHDDAIESLLDRGRLGAASMAVGIARGAHEYSRHYATQRKAFGGPISRFEALRRYFADAVTATDAGALLVYRAATQWDTGQATMPGTSMAKLFCCEAAYRATKNAVQILGGNGYSREYPVERMYRDAMTLGVLESPGDLHREFIAARLLGDKS